jgi:hypothetical protein
MKHRSRRGSMAALAFVGMIPLVVALGAFGIDLMHVNATKAELQRSCDAAALAGAARLGLWDHDAPKGESARQSADMMLKLNVADGRLVDNGNPDIKTAVSFPKEPVKGIGGQCRVDAEMKIRGLFSAIFSNYTQTVNATATASATGIVNEAFAGQVYPIALGLNVADPVTGVPLAAKKVGDQLVIWFAPDGQDNAGWTTLNEGGGANAVRELIDGYRNPSKSNASRSVKVNDAIDLKNGVMASAISEVAQHVGETVVFPVVDVTKFNQNATIVGFVGLTITSVDGTQIVGVLNKGEMTGIFNSTVPAYDNSAANADQFFSDKQVSAPRIIQ